MANLEMDSAALLAWHVAMGVDETIDHDTVNRFDAPVQEAQALTDETASVNVPRQNSQNAQNSMRDATSPQSFSHMPKPVAARPAQAATGAGPEAASKVAQQCNDLDALYQALENFDGGHFKRTAKNTVFSDGVRGAPIMIMGESPGAEEDGSGKPFIGPWGKLLDRMLAFTNMSRDDNIYISNLVPWRQLGSRKPGKDVLAMCLPFARRHIELAKPQILLMLGATSAQTLLDSDKGITQLRGRWHELDFDGHKLAAIATYHPAYLIRTPAQKGRAWQDILSVKERLNSFNA